MARLNKLLTGHQITDEVINRTSSASLPLGHDTILQTGVVVRTSAGGGGTLLTLTTDYTLGSADSRLTTEAGQNVYTKLAVANGAYQNMNLYVTYKTVGDYASVESVDDISSPVGSMTMFAGASSPDGWLFCQGQAISRSTYARLFTAIGATWGVGDGSTTFNLPDMREASPYGAGTYSAVTGTTHGAISTHDALALGEFGDDRFETHIHTVTNGAGGTSAQLSRYVSSDNTSASLSTNPPSTGRIGNTTRGKIIGVNYIIKY